MAVFDLCEGRPHTFPNAEEKKKILIWGSVGVVCLVVLIIIIVVATQSDPENPPKGRHALINAPLVDGHNNLASNIRYFLKNNLNDLDFEHVGGGGGVLQNCSHCKTDLTRLKKGMVSTQFWSVNAACGGQYKDAVAETLEQIDVMKRLVHKYPKMMTMVTSSHGIMDAFKDKKIGSVLGVEGGHSIDGRLGVLRTFYDLGVRFMTLTWKCSTPWADSSTNFTAPVHNLTDFGKTIVIEMNRLGMMIDLSHSSDFVVSKVLQVSKAPVIFSHSAARSMYNNSSNVNDETLQKLKENGGIVMVNFNPKYLAEADSLVNISTVISHINHVAEVAGVEHVGVGANYDGTESTPKELEDVSKYPLLFDMLQNNNSNRWTIENLEKLAGKNLIRVFKKVEQVKEDMKSEPPAQAWISQNDLSPENNEPCRNRFDVAEDEPDGNDDATTAPTITTSTAVVVTHETPSSTTPIVSTLDNASASSRGELVTSTSATDAMKR